MKHAQQRSSRLWHGDELFQQAERVPEPQRPEPIPAAQARELWLPTQADELEAEYAA